MYLGPTDENVKIYCHPDILKYFPTSKLMPHRLTCGSGASSDWMPEPDTARLQLSQSLLLLPKPDTIQIFDRVRHYFCGRICAEDSICQVLPNTLSDWKEERTLIPLFQFTLYTSNIFSNTFMYVVWPKNHEIRITLIRHLPLRQPWAGKTPRTKPHRRQQMPRKKEKRTQTNRAALHRRNTKERYPPSTVELPTRRSLGFERPHFPTRRVPWPANQPAARQNDTDCPTRSFETGFPQSQPVRHLIALIFDWDMVWWAGRRWWGLRRTGRI